MLFVFFLKRSTYAQQNREQHECMQHPKYYNAEPLLEESLKDIVRGC